MGIFKKSVRFTYERILDGWARLDDLSAFMPSTDPLSWIIKWVVYVVGKIGESVRTSYYKSLYAPKEAYELYSPTVKDPYGKDRRDKSLKNLNRRMIYSIAEYKEKHGFRLTAQEKSVLDEVREMTPP